MNPKSKVHVFLKSTTIVLCLLSVSMASAGIFSLDPRAPGTRAGRGTFYGLYQYWDSKTDVVGNISFQDHLPNVTGDVVFELKESNAWGFGFGYELNNHWTINGEFSFGYPDYKLSYNNQQITGEAYVSSGSLNIDFNILKGRFTPFVTGGVGYLYFDTGIPAGPAGEVCWWDYWWGYTCTTVISSYANTYWAVNAGAGLRWDIGDRLFLKASAIVQWVDTHNASDWNDYTRYTFTFGLKF